MKELNDSVASINKEKFDSYEELRSSGSVNMFNISQIQNLLDLTRVEIMDIQKNYQDYYDKYN